MSAATRMPRADQPASQPPPPNDPARDHDAPGPDVPITESTDPLFGVDPAGSETADGIAGHKFLVTFFPNEKARTLRVANSTMAQLAEFITRQTAASKMALPWLKLAIFGDKPSDKGCLRTNANLVQITGIEAEHDAGEVSFDTAVAAMRRQWNSLHRLHVAELTCQGARNAGASWCRCRGLLPPDCAGKTGRAHQRPVRRGNHDRKLHAIAGVSVRPRQQSRSPRRGDRRQFSRLRDDLDAGVDPQGRQQGWPGHGNGAASRFNGVGRTAARASMTIRSGSTATRSRPRSTSSAAIAGMKSG